MLTPQELTVPAFEDSGDIFIELTPVDDDIDEGSFETLNIGILEEGVCSRNLKAVSFSIQDEDIRGVEVSPQQLIVVEGGEAATYTLELTSQPSGPLTVTLTLQSGGDGGEASAVLPAVLIEPMELSFERPNDAPWSEPREIRVSVADNGVEEDPRQATIVHGLTGSDYQSNGVPVPDVLLRVVERGLVLTETAAVNEGEEYRYEVALRSPPAGAVEVAVLVSQGRALRSLETDNGRFEIADRDSVEVPGVLSFTPENWHRTQSVIVRTTDNDYSSPDGLEQVLITHIALGADYGGEKATLTLTVLDNYEPARSITLSLRPSQLSEAAGRVVVTVTAGIDRPRQQDTMVQLRVVAEPVDDDPATGGYATAGRNSDYAVDSASFFLVIEAYDSGGSGNFTLLLIDDDIDENGGEVFLVAAVADLDNVRAHGTATLTIIDDDERGLRISRERLFLVEGGEAEVYSVRLTSQPTALVGVFIQVDYGAAMEGMAMDGMADSVLLNGIPELLLTFGVSGENAWDQEQEVRVTLEENTDSNENREAILRHSAEGGDYQGLPGAAVALRLADRGIRISPTELSVLEGGTAEYSLVLLSAPTASVQVQLSLSDADAIDHLEIGGQRTAVASDPLPSLTFTTDNWDTPQTVRVQAQDNPYSGENEPVTISHSASSDDEGYAGLAIDAVELTIDNEDLESDMLLLEVRLGDSGDFGPFVQFNEERPLGGALVDNVVDVQLRAHLNEAPFRDDRVLLLSVDEELSLATLGRDFSATLTATPDDPEGTGIGQGWIAPGAAALRLTLPKERTTITVGLEFQVKADRSDEDDGEDIQIGGTLEDLSARTAAPVFLDIIDNDVRGLDIRPQALTLVEGGETRTYEVRLTSEPDPDPNRDGVLAPAEGEVSVQIRIAGTETPPGAAPDRIKRVPNSLVFGGDSGPQWNEWQTVDVSLAENDSRHDTREAFLRHSTEGTDYSAAPASQVSLTLVDRRILISTDRLTVVEGGAASYTVTLISPPTGEVTVRVSIARGRLGADGSAAVADAVLAERPLIFDGDDWDQPQAVTVRLADNDYSGENRQIRMEHVAVGGGYDSAQAATVTLTVVNEEEEETTKVRLSLSHAELREDQGPVPVRVRATLDVPRQQDTVLTLVFDDIPEDSPDAAELGLDFTSDRQLPRFIIPAFGRYGELELTLTPINDNIDEGDSDPLFFSVFTEGGLTVVPARLDILDDDSAGVTVTPASRRVRPGQPVGYALVLDTVPNFGTVTVIARVRAAPGSEARAEDIEVPGPLRFNDANWDRPQQLRLEAAEEVGGFGGLIIEFDASSEDPPYNIVAVASATLELTDVDTSLQSLELRLSRGGERLPLRQQPDGDVGFAPRVADYEAEIPSGARSAVLTATPTVTRDNAGESEQSPGEVYLFLDGEPQGNGADVAGDEVRLDLSTGGELFVFDIEVSVALPQENGETPPAVQNYRLTLRRALPEGAGLQILVVDEDGGRTPLTAGTPLRFGPDEEGMNLIFVVRAGGNRYPISELRVNHGDDFTLLSEDDGNPTRVEEGRLALSRGEVVADGSFETPVRLVRNGPALSEDFDFRLSFRATAQRPRAAGAEELSAELAGTLEANSETETEIRANYSGEAQGEELLPVSTTVRVSANGPLTLVWSLGRSGGGDRSFKQSDFTSTLSVGETATLRMAQDDDEELRQVLSLDGSEGEVEVRIAATHGGSLSKIRDPEQLSFTLVFERPRALLRPVVDAEPLRAFRDPLFVFVEEGERLNRQNRRHPPELDLQLPLELVLTADSTPLQGRDGILRGLDLSPTMTIGGEATEGLSLGGGSGRDLLFAAAEPRNGVAVAVGIRVPDPRVRVDELRFDAHFLSLDHPLEVPFDRVSGNDFKGDERVFSISLRGEQPAAETWTLSVANVLELEDNGYKAEEVIQVPGERLLNIIRKPAGGGDNYSSEIVSVQVFDDIVPGIEPGAPTEELTAEQLSATLAVDGAVPPEVRQLLDAEGPATLTLIVGVTPAHDRPATGEERQARTRTRTLRIRRLRADATDSRVALRFAYTPPPGLGRAGVFNRIIPLATGISARLEATLSPAALVLPKGGTAEVLLVVSNLLLGEDPCSVLVFRHSADLQVAPRACAGVDRTNRRFEQRLEVRVDQDATAPDYVIRVDVNLGGRRNLRAEFRIDINDAPRYQGETTLRVNESGVETTVIEVQLGSASDGVAGVEEYLLRVVDPDGGLRFLEPSQLRLEVIGFEDEGRPIGDLRHSNNYFDLEASVVEQKKTDEQAGPEGNGNELSLTLRISGKLATPFGSVVELRLSGVGDGYGEGFEQRLRVRVEDVAPTFRLRAELDDKAVPVYLEQQQPLALELSFSDGSRDGTGGAPTFVVAEAPDDLAVRVDAVNRRVTLRRLNAPGRGGLVRLAVLDSQGGRTELPFTVERPALLPQIRPQNPLFIVVGGTEERAVELEQGTGIEDLEWTASVSVGSGLGIELSRPDSRGHVDLEVTASPSAPPGQARILLEASAYDGIHRRRVEMPVVVVPAEPKPRLQLSLKAVVDDREPAVISSFPANDTLFVQATLEGEVPEELLDRVATFSIAIAKVGAAGPGAARTTTLTTVEVGAGADEIDIEVLVETGALTTAEGALLGLQPGDVVEVSIEHLWADGEIIAGDRLRLPVTTTISASSLDSDNDGVVDAFDDNEDPSTLGPAAAPITAAVARVTEDRIDVQGARQVSLALGNLARSLGLGQCGDVTMALTVGMDGDPPVLSGCGGLSENFAGLAQSQSLALGQRFGEGDYQLIDLSADFDSSAVNHDEPLVVSLPFDPQSTRVYRYDGQAWVPVLDAGLPGPDGGPAALSNIGDCDTCFYGVDSDRDGSVEMLLLLQTVEDLSLALAADASGYQNRVINIEVDPEAEENPLLIIPLELGADLENVRVITEMDGVSGVYSETATIGGGRQHRPGCGAARPEAHGGRPRGGAGRGAGRRRRRGRRPDPAGRSCQSAAGYPLHAGRRGDDLDPYRGRRRNCGDRTGSGPRRRRRQLRAAAD